MFTLQTQSTHLHSKKTWTGTTRTLNQPYPEQKTLLRGGGKWDFCTTKLYYHDAMQCNLRTMQRLSLYAWHLQQTTPSSGNVSHSHRITRWEFSVVRLRAIRYRTPVVQRIKYFKYSFVTCLCFLSLSIYCRLFPLVEKRKRMQDVEKGEVIFVVWTSESLAQSTCVFIVLLLHVNNIYVSG